MYKRCTIDRCHIVYSGGPLGGLSECTINKSTFVLDGAAKNTLDFLRSLYTRPDMRNLVEGWIAFIQGSQAQIVTPKKPH